MSLTAICTVKVGKKYSAEYLNNLYCMLKRNAVIPFEFYCITDNPEKILSKINIVPIVPRFWGWWNFMEFYSASFCEGKTKIYFGLDTIITGNIDRILVQEDYTLSKDFNYLVNAPTCKYAKTYADCAAVIPKNREMSWLYDEFIREHLATGLGKTRAPMHVWVTEKLKEKQIKPLLWQDIEPDIMCSYKWPSIKTEQPKEPMVFFHGSPSVEDEAKTSSWINRHWNCELE